MILLFRKTKLLVLSSSCHQVGMRQKNAFRDTCGTAGEKDESRIFSGLDDGSFVRLFAMAD